jgi:uncharacterized protein YbjT (DUF2867 family)
MVNVLILGANGQLARNTARLFLALTDARLTLYLRRARRLENPDPRRVSIVEGDVLDAQTLQGAMRGQDVVFASLAGALEQQARAIVEPRGGAPLAPGSALL